MSADQIVDAIVNQGMLPLFYADSETITIKIVETLYKAGIRVFEYTNRGDAAITNFSKLVIARDERMPDLLLGIGTIKSKKEAEQYIQVGADFIVAPIVNTEVAKFCNEKEILWIPGCMTPSEIYEAQTFHAKLIKIFPANILGPEFVSSIKELFRGQKFMPTGGVTIEEHNITKWFNSGVVALGMGSQMIGKDIIQHKNYDELEKRTKKAFALIADYRK